MPGKKTPKTSLDRDPVGQYARAVRDGRELAGPYVRLACERHLRDIEEAKSPKRGITWDQAAADRVFEYFATVLTLTDGEPFHLHPSQQFIVGSLFGWKRKDGTRRYRQAYIEQGKGNGKSPICAGIGLYMLTADGEQEGQVFAAAVDREQARVPYQFAVNMVDRSDLLSSAITKSGGKFGDPTRVHNLFHRKSGSYFRPLTSESTGRGKSGFLVHCAILDEVHEHPTNAMVEFVKANTKGRRQPLILMITNSGVYDTTSVCWTYHEYAARLLQCTGEPDDSFFAYVCGLDQGDDWKDPGVWKKANPLLGVSIPASYLEQQVREAVGMPSKQSIVRRLNFCEWVDSQNPLFDPEAWSACGDALDVEELIGRECFGALDLSGKNDLTTLVLVFPDIDEYEEADLERDEQIHAEAADMAAALDIEVGKALAITIAKRRKKKVLSFFWTPHDTLRERSERDRAPYEDWVRDGYLLTTPGSSISYAFVAEKVKQLLRTHNIRAVAFDPYRIDDLQREMDALDCDVVLIKHGQGFRAMDPAIEALEDDVLERRLQHGNHPVLNWNVQNALAEKNAAGLRMFNKRKSTGRIDGIVALAMANYLSASFVDEPSPRYAATVI